jgi:hypothetical protein
MTIRHIVLLQFKQDTPAVAIDSCMAAFAELPGKIDGITSFEHGANVSPEGLSKGYTQLAIVTFSSAAMRDTYLDHPAHLDFVAKLKSLIADVLVFDFEI